MIIAFCTLLLVITVYIHIIQIWVVKNWTSLNLFTYYFSIFFFYHGNIFLIHLLIFHWNNILCREYLGKHLIILSVGNNGMTLGPATTEYSISKERKKIKKKKRDLEIHTLSLWSHKHPEIGPIRLLISEYLCLIVTQIWAIGTVR